MKPRCATAVRAAAQRLGMPKPTDAELKAIDERLADTMRSLARTDPDWQGRTHEERVRLAADQAQADIRAEAASKADEAREYVFAQIARAQRLSEANAKELATHRTDLDAIEARMAEVHPSPALAALGAKVSEAQTLAQAQAAHASAREEFYRLGAVPKLKRKLQPNYEADREYAGLLMQAAEHRLEMAKLRAAPAPAGAARAGLGAAKDAGRGPELTLDQQIAQRLAIEHPDLQIILPGGEERIRMADATARIESERQADLQWVDLVRAAARCALGAE